MKKAEGTEKAIPKEEAKDPKLIRLGAKYMLSTQLLPNMVENKKIKAGYHTNDRECKSPFIVKIVRLTNRAKLRVDHYQKWGPALRDRFLEGDGTRQLNLYVPYEILVDDKHAFVLTNIAPLFSLNEFIVKDKQQFYEFQIRAILLSILPELDFIQQLTVLGASGSAELAPFIHNAISPDHILISQDLDGTLLYHLGGFDHSIWTGDQDWINILQRTTKVTCFTAPEIRGGLWEDVKKLKSDVYSLGVLLLLLLHGERADPEVLTRPPLSGEATITVSEKLRDLLKSCLEVNVDKRASVKQLLQHPFVRYMPSFSTGTKYSLITSIGKGAYGVVWSAKNKDNAEVAIKQIDIRKCNNDPKNHKMLLEEIAIMQELREVPYIVRYIDCYQTVNDYMIVMEYMPDGNLQQYVVGLPSRAEDDINIVGYNIARGIAELHRRHIIHRDIKPENILIAQNKLHEIVDTKLADFGTSRKCEQAGPFSVAGTDGFMAPELRGPGPIIYDWKVDVYSYGAVLYFMAYGSPPRPSDLPRNSYSAPFNDLLRACLQVDPKRRPTMKEVLEHPWFATNEVVIPVINEPLPYSYDPAKDQIGSNTFGTTYKCRRGGSLYVLILCHLNKTEGTNADDKQHSDGGKKAKIKRCIHAWNKIAMCQVCRLIDYFEYQNDIYIIREYWDGCSLADIVHTATLDETVIMRLAQQVASALKGIHDRDFIHLHLTCENVKILDFGDDDQKVKIAGLELARLSNNPTNTIIVPNDVQFAPEYAIPVQDKPIITKKADIWSYGMLLYSLVYKESPNARNSFHTLPKGMIHPANPYSSLWPELINLCVVQKPETRLSIDQVLSFLHEHPITPASQ